MSTRRRSPTMAASPYRSPRTLAFLVMFLLAVNIVTSALVVSAGLSQLDMIERMKTARGSETQPMTDAELEAQDARTASAAATWLIVYVVTAIAFATWFRRMHANLPALGATRLRFTSGWAAGGWFVPILNLVRPYEVAQEIWAGSSPAPEPPPPPPVSATLGGAEVEESRIARRQERIRTRRSAESSGLLKAWWGCWIAWNALAIIAAKVEGAALGSLNPMMSDAQYASAMESLHSATQFTLVTDLLDIPMALLAIYVVHAMYTRQVERAQARFAISDARFPHDGSDAARGP